MAAVDYALLVTGVFQLGCGFLQVRRGRRIEANGGRDTGSFIDPSNQTKGYVFFLLGAALIAGHFGLFR